MLQVLPFVEQYPLRRKNLVGLVALYSHKVAKILYDLEWSTLDNPFTEASGAKVLEDNHKWHPCTC